MPEIIQIPKNQILQHVSKMDSTNGVAVLTDKEKVPYGVVIHFGALDSDTRSALLKNVEFNPAHTLTQLVAKVV